MHTRFSFIRLTLPSIYLMLWLQCEVSFGQEFKNEIRPLLKKYCIQCHGVDEQNSGIRFDQIDGYQQSDRHLWTLAHEALIAGEMPPEEELQPSAREKQQIRTWITRQAKARSLELAGSQRRLNRRELSAALQDLVGLPIDFAAGLPADGLTAGFDTGAQGLQDAADSVAQWLEVTRRAVESIRFLEPDRQKKISIDFREHDFTDFRKFLSKQWDERSEQIFTRSKRLLCKKNVGVYLPTQWTGDRGNSFLAVPAPANKRAALKMTLRVKAQRPLEGLPEPMLWVKIGGKYIDYRSIGEEPQTLTYSVRMEDHLVEDQVIKVMLRSFVEVPYAVKGFENDDRSKPEDKIPGGIGTYRPRFDRKKLRTPDVQPVPSIIVEWIEIDFDHQQVWPVPSRHGNLKELTDSEQSARELLALWMDRAWRRPVTTGEMEKFFTLYKNLRAQEFSFDDALRSTFQSVLMGGPFRYLASPSDKDPVIAQHAIASRLSFMLIGSPPDADLRSLARKGKLRDPRVLGEQVDRLLADPRSDAFFRPFVMQWLNLNQPITLVMSHFKKQDFKFGRNMKASMKEETIQYVSKVIRDNLSVRELVSSDWTMMNDILAVHYGYEGIEGGALRRVKLKSRSQDPRGGGLLSHAGIQSMLCWMGDNWLIYRGSWALNHILDDPPPNPPLEVPELSPFDKANSGRSFRELLAQHQEDRNCSICHRKMDPLGFAFQNFDLSGRWRNVEYERYHRYELEGKIEWRGVGKTRPVDASGALPRGEKFGSFVEFKQLLVKHYTDDIVRGLLKKLTLYGTGRRADVLDMVTIRGIMKEQAKNEYAMRDLLKALIRSRIFLETEGSETLK